ncbi:MAG: hypothetical protein HND48_03475 [Chloroflexi bacterium]|nr:hypothetical protein [Chloroflexota bacterium]
MDAKHPIPLTIITGFLGAGKTTLLNRILSANHGLRIAVLVNDFGAVNIDSQLVVNVEGETYSLSNGCICCTIRDDLVKAVRDALNRPESPRSHHHRDVRRQRPIGGRINPARRQCRHHRQHPDGD